LTVGGRVQSLPFQRMILEMADYDGRNHNADKLKREGRAGDSPDREGREKKIYCAAGERTRVTQQVGGARVRRFRGRGLLRLSRTRLRCIPRPRAPATRFFEEFFGARPCFVDSRRFLAVSETHEPGSNNRKRLMLQALWFPEPQRSAQLRPGGRSL